MTVAGRHVRNCSNAHASSTRARNVTEALSTVRPFRARNGKCKHQPPNETVTNEVNYDAAAIPEELGRLGSSWKQSPEIKSGPLTRPTGQGHSNEASHRRHGVHMPRNAFGAGIEPSTASVTEENPDLVATRSGTRLQGTPMSENLAGINSTALLSLHALASSTCLSWRWSCQLFRASRVRLDIHGRRRTRETRPVLVRLTVLTPHTKRNNQGAPT